MTDITCIIPGPKKEMLRRPLGDLWCFRCRAHLPHDLVVVCDEEPSYYDPIALRKCSRCRGDYTSFPGT